MRGIIWLAPAFAVAAFAATSGGELSLIDAVKADNRTAALELINQHVNVNAAAPDGTTALIWAAHNGDADQGTDHAEGENRDVVECIDARRHL